MRVSLNLRTFKQLIRKRRKVVGNVNENVEHVKKSSATSESLRKRQKVVENVKDVLEKT